MLFKDVDDWDWKKRFPNLESATNLLLKQLKIQARYPVLVLPRQVQAIS